MSTAPLNVTRIWLTVCRLPNTSLTELKLTGGGSDTGTGTGTGAGSDTVNMEEPVTPRNEATIADWPEATAVAMPVELTTATPGTDDDQDTWFVRSTVVWSERMPVAMNCVEPPCSIVELEAVTLMETKDGA